MSKKMKQWDDKRQLVDEAHHYLTHYQEHLDLLSAKKAEICLRRASELETSENWKNMYGMCAWKLERAIDSSKSMILQRTKEVLTALWGD